MWSKIRDFVGEYEKSSTRVSIAVDLDYIS